MPVYIAMLRGINVSGQKLIKMEKLRATFAALGFADVQTYIQSGNVVFTAAKVSNTVLEKKIRAAIAKEYGFDVPVIVRTVAELAACVQNNPLRVLAEKDEARSLVAFLSAPAPTDAAELLQPLAMKSERFTVCGREIYLHYPHGSGDTKLSNTAIEKKLSVQSTTRNWRTVKTLLELAQG